jgi:purine-nucleoside phosphorylase
MNPRQREAITAANFIRGLCPWLNESVTPIGLVLGTGWDVIKDENATEIPFQHIPGFSGLEHIDGHARKLLVGKIAGKHVVALRGRVHMNEAPCDPNIPRMVRLQTEMLFQLGVKQIIVTSAVGSLHNFVKVGSVVIIDGFITVYAPEMPLWANEFYSPEDMISERLSFIAHRAKHEQEGITSLTEVAHVMVRGPFFEGRKYDKALLAASGAKVVGMSMLPEACIAAIYGAEFLGLGFVTNSPFEVHSHENNVERAKELSEKLGDYLTRIIRMI